MRILAEAPLDQQFSFVHFASAMPFNVWDMESSYIVRGGIPCIDGVSSQHMHDLPQGQGLKEMDMLVWLGDFNYRVDAEYAEAKGLVRRNDLLPLLSKVPLPWHSMHASACHLAPVLGP